MTATLSIPTLDDFAVRNLEYAERVITDVELTADLPPDAHIVVYPDADPLLAGYNLAIAHYRQGAGETVYIIRVAADGTLAAPTPLPR